MKPMSFPLLQHADIAKRIPHQGSMCLLDSVTAWDLNQISCEASSHRDANNPLRANNRLGAACGIEYAAQAMAVHGALVAEAQAQNDDAIERPKVGYLVSVRGVILHAERLDNLSSPLSIHVQRLSGDTATILYSFTVHAEKLLLLEGRAAVLLDAAPISA